MNAPDFRLFAALFLSAVFLTAQIPAGALATEAPAVSEASAVSETTVPAETSQPSSPPETSIPETSLPAASSAETSLPAESATETSLPADSSTETSLPADSSTETSLPTTPTTETSLPADSATETSLPADSATETSLPADSATETSLPAASMPETSFSTLPALLSSPPPPEAPAGPGLYFGLLHGHTGISSGTGSPAEAFAYAAQAGLDFFAVTDHSHSFDQQELGQIFTDASAISQDWSEGRSAAASATSYNFVGLWGYEMSWPGQMKLGHISTFATPGFQSWKQDPYQDYDGALMHYYQALAGVSNSVSQFNHPGSQYGTFEDFQYSQSADQAVFLMELDPHSQEDLDRYIQALDLGWHLAPSFRHDGYGHHWGIDSPSRTAIDATTLTEAGILDAIRQYQVYATGDADLEITYSLDGHRMGSRLKRSQVGETADVTVHLADPTDSAIGLVEVITDGGQTAARQTLSANSGSLCFFLPPDAGYYFLRVTQPDGDMAVTAPVWMEGQVQLGIADLTCETALPVQHEEVSLTITLYNQSSRDFMVDSLEILADDSLITACDLQRIPAGSTLSVPVSLRCSSVGLTTIKAVLAGTLDGLPRTDQRELQLHFHQSQQITSILVDGSHGNQGLDQLTILKQLALQDNIALTATTQDISGEALKNARFFLVCPPTKPFSEEFLAAVAAYAQYGGNLVVCGQGDNQDPDFHSAAQLNRLLAAVGSSMQIRDDLAVDAVNNGGSQESLYPEEINREAPWCKPVSQNQVFRAVSSATVDPGSGCWLVKGFSTTGSSDADADGLPGGNIPAPALLAWEPLPGGGAVIAAGSLFFADDNMAPPKNIWDEPYANCTIAQVLLGLGGDPVPLSTIQEARDGRQNQLFRIQGYVTAGTSNPHNRFPDTLYLQDRTGGMAVVPFGNTSIQLGTPVEITGFAGMQNGNRILKVSSWKILEGGFYQHLPLEGAWQELLDPERHEGTLVQVEGLCREIYCRADDTMAGCLLQDSQGFQAKILIEDHIGNSADGENELHKSIRKGRKVRAMGLLYIDTNGDPVIRVRNCEEVVFVPPRIYPGMNPPTGDFPLSRLLAALSGAGLGLAALRKRKNKSSTAGKVRSL